MVRFKFCCLLTKRKATNLIENFTEIICRLMTSYQRDAQSFISMKEILEDYHFNCPEKENFDLQVYELRLILKKVFPDLERVQRRVNGSRTWQYPLAKTNNQFTGVSDFINWQDLPTFVDGLGWQLSSTSPEFMEWVRIRSQDVCDGNRLLQEIKIFYDWTFTVFVNNRQISKDTLGIQ